MPLLELQPESGDLVGLVLFGWLSGLGLAWISFQAGWLLCVLLCHALARGLRRFGWPALALTLLLELCVAALAWLCCALLYAYTRDALALLLLLPAMPLDALCTRWTWRRLSEALGARVAAP